MSRRRVRSTIRWDSVLISVLGVTFGLGVGRPFRWLLVQALQDDFPLRLVIPAGQLALIVLVAVLAGRRRPTRTSCSQLRRAEGRRDRATHAAQVAPRSR
jgi:uncharacterized membrane protein YfcA